MIYISFGIAIPQVIFQLYQAYLQAAKKSKKVASLTVIKALIGIGLAIAIMVQMTDERYYAKAIGQGDRCHYFVPDYTMVSKKTYFIIC
ncbi:MAG: hypothetical protein U5L09_08910 [Bacteroidales bacterium]|nr:hypothetical protein [Bacteroidales bacterium]